MKSQALAWAKALLTGVEVENSELATFISGLSYQGESLEEMCKVPNPCKYTFNKNKYECLVLLTNSFHYNGLDYLEDIYSTPLYLVYGVHKASDHGG